MYNLLVPKLCTTFAAKFNGCAAVGRALCRRLPFALAETL